MYKVSDQVLYGIHGICNIIAMEERKVDKQKKMFFVLEPVDHPGARFYVPAQNQAAMAKLRKLMTAQELDALLHSDAVREDCWIADESRRKLYYRDLINSGDRAALLSMVGSLHRHKAAQAAAGRKFHLCDENFLRDAEKLLSAEFSLVLKMDPKDVGAYIKESLQAE